MSVKEVYLEGNPPWGFRMNGGADAGHPLRISRVNPGSKAEAKGVREGDLITSINGQSTKCLTNSESHALLRTVKENLLLGLNEEKNASPRRRSREIKSASIISQEKERSESPAQPKGNYKPSASQKRHQRRTRLKQRIKDILGFKTKEKKDPDDEGWVIVDATLHGQDAHSVSELDTDEENRCNMGLGKEDTITNDSEEIYDNFEFKKNQESFHSPTSNNTTPLMLRKDQNQFGFTETVQTKEEKICITGITSDNKFDSNESLPDYKNITYSPSTTVRNSDFHDKKNTSYFLENERNISEPKEIWLLRNEDTKEQSANEACICEDEGVSETLKTLPPSDMLEICNATIMIQDDRLAKELHVPLALPEDDKVETARSSRNSNPDYEPIEINSSIIYPPYSSTLNYYFPQRRFLEAISEENSDLSESNEEKQEKSEKPWENSELIKQANSIATIPNDWFGSDEGIDTSWRDGKSIEEVSDVAIVSDSFSDSDLISEDLKITRGVGDDGIIRYNINKSKSNESSSIQHDNRNVKVLGKPPIQTPLSNKMDIKSQNQQVDKIMHINKVSGQKNVDEKLPKTDIVNKELSHKVFEKKSTSVGSKVTCKILKHDELTSKESLKNIGDKTKITVSSDKNVKPGSDKQIYKQCPEVKPELSNASKVSCKIIEGTDVQTNSPKLNEKPAKVLNNNSSANSSPNVNKKSILVDSNKTKSPTQEKKYMKTTPSSGVLKHVVFSYYNESNELKKIDALKNHENKTEKEKEITQRNTGVPDKEKAEIPNTSRIELSKEVIKPCSEKDIELVYIDSSDSDAFSNMSNLSARTSSIFEKEESIVLDENVAKKENCSQSLDNNRNLIINKEMININQSVKEISDICSSNSVEKINIQSCKNKHMSSKLKESMLPNLLSPVLSRKSASKPHLKKRRFSYPMSERDLLRECSEVSCFNCSATLSPTLANTEVKETSNSTSSKVLTSTVPIKELKAKDSPVAIRKLSLRSLPGTPSPNNLSFSSSKYENQSFESIALEFSDGSVSSESYTLPDIAQDNDLSDVSTDTIKYFHITESPKVVRRNPNVASEIVDLHKKFVERRGYHEASPVLKTKNEKGIEKTPEPDLIALSKCKERSEQSYTPELLAEAANLLALHKYHESRQRKMKSERKDETKSSIPTINTAEKQPERLVVENKHQGNVKDGKKLTDLPTEIGMNEKIIECKQANKSVSTENETVGKSRLLELFQKLDSKSSTTECTSESEPFPYWLILGDNVDLENINELSQKSVVPAKGEEERSTPEKSYSDDLKEECSESELPSVSNAQINASLVVLSSLPPGEIFNRKMYEEYLGKMAELAERRNMKIIKVSTVPSTVSLPSESQPLESEFMNKVKERNEKLGIVIDEDESDEKITNVKANNVDELPKHLKELMEITKECGDVVGQAGLLVEIDEALSPEGKGFLTARGVWSPAQTPEAERKKFDFSNELKEEKEREKQREEEEKREPSPAVWTPRSAGASPTVERKFRSVNFQSPTPSRKEFKTSNETHDTPELPKELPIEPEKDSKSRLISSSSENSTLSSSLRLPAAQNPTITLLQKAREGHIPRGAQYLEEQPAVGPDEIIYSVKKEHVSEDQSKKIVELGPRKIEGIGPTTKEGIPIVLRSEVKEDNQQRWYKRMYDSLHKAEFDKDFVTVKYRTRRGQYPYSSYSGGYSSEPERIGYDSDASLSKYATLDRRKIRNKENDFTTSTMPRNRYGQGVNYAVNVYKNQPGRIEDYEPGNSSIADKETKKWWDEVMDIFDGDLNESKSNHHPSKVSGKPFTYSLKDTGYESDSTLVFRRRENNMSGQLLSPTEQRMAYKVIQKGGEVPFQGLRKSAPERPKEDSEIEYFPLSPTLTRIRVHKRIPTEKVYYPVSTDISYPAVKRTSRSVVPSPPRRESSKYNPTLKMFTQGGTSSPERKPDYYQDRFVARLSKSENIDAKAEKPHGKIKTSSSLVKYEQPKPQYGAIRQKKEVLRKSPELKAPGEVKKALKETKVLPGTVVKSSTTLYSSVRNKKPKEDKALKVTVAISTKGKEILSPTSTSSKSDTRKSPLLSKPATRLKADSPPVSRGPRPSSRSSVASTTISEHQKKITKKEITIDPKKKKEKKSETTNRVIDKNKEDEKKKVKKKQENGKKKNGSKKKDKENIPQDVSDKTEEIIALPEPPKQQDFFQKLLLRESNSPCPSITSTTVSRTPSVLERAKKFSQPQNNCFKSEPSLRNLNVYLSQKRPVSESRFRSLERKSSRALSPFYGTYDFFDKLDKFDRHNNVWDYSLTYGPAYDSVKSRSSSEPPHTSPTFSQDVCDNTESVSPSTSRSPSCRRIRRPSSRAIETISGVRRKFRSKSLNEADRQSHMGSTSSLSMSQFTDHEEYRTYFFELLHQTKKSDKFKELHKFYSSLERMAELEKTTSNTDLRPRLKGEEVIDFDRWKQLRNKEKAEKELNTLYEKLKDDQKEKGFLFQPKEPIRWSGDRGLRHKEKSVEDLRVQFQKLVENSQSEKKQEIDTSKDVYKPLWRGNSVANLANSLTSITGSKRGRPVKENNQSLIKPSVKKDKEIGSRLWSSLSMEQVNALKNQLTEIYSTVSNLKQERIQKLKQNIEDYEVNITDLRNESPLHVRSNSLVAPDQLYSPAVRKKSSKRQECMKADSISTLPSWKSTSLSENEKRKLSMSLSAEVKERIKKKKHGTLVIPRETLGAVAAIKGTKKFKSPCNSETSPRTCYSLLSDDSFDKGEEKNKDFLLVLTPKDKECDVKKIVDDWGSKEHARLVQTTSSSSSSASTVIHLGYKDEFKASGSRISDLSQSHTDLRHEPEAYRAERKALYSSQSFTNLKDLFGEKNATTYATLPLRNIRKPCYSSTDSLYKSISPDPMKYYRAYLNVVKAGDVRKLREKFESYDDIYNLRKEQSPVRKMFQSDPDLTRDFLSRKGGEFKKVVIKGQEMGDVQGLRKKYEPRKVISPVPFKVEDRYMPHINVISKTATLQRRALTPPSRAEVSRTGKVDRLKDRFEKQGMSLLGQMYTSTPEITELRDIAPYLECEWVAHQNPRRSPSRRKIRPRPASASPIRQSILKQTDIFANQEFNPEIHRPLYRYQPEPWQSKSWARPTVTFKEPLGNPIPTPPRDGTSRQRLQESPHRYVESEVNIHYKSPVRREAKAAWPEDELAQRQAEIMRRIYQEQKRTKYLNELHDMYSRRHTDNLLPSQKSPIPLNRYDDFPVEVQPPRPRDRTPEPKLVARALYNFVGQTSRELSFRRGDIIYVRRQIDRNWYEGEHNAMIGLFPFNYVEIIPYDGIRTLPKKASEGQARAKFNFQAQTHLELSLVKGELVLLTRRVDENWFEGRIGNRKGIFPVSYVEVLVEPGERPETPSSGNAPSKPLVAPASHSVMLNGAKDLGQQHYQPPRPTIYSSSSLPPANKIHDISLVNETLHIDTQSDPVPYRVMYNYRPQNEDELELKEGDIVYVMEKCDDGWYVGSLHRNGQFGTFPGNYVERIQ